MQIPVVVVEHARFEQEPKSLFAPRKISGVKDMHYSPRFSNEYWALGTGKRIRIYWRGVDERIRSRDPGYRSWGSEPFLSQLLRTPSFTLKFLPAIKGHIEKNNIEFPTATRDLRRSYETLFTDHNLFVEFYRLITSHQWELWRVPHGNKFIRSDDPVVICGSVKHHSWQLVHSIYIS